MELLDHDLISKEIEVDGYIHQVGFIDEDNFFAVCAEGSIHWFSKDNDEAILSYQAQSNGILSSAFNTSNNTLLVGGQNGSIKIYNKDGELNQLKMPALWVDHIKCSPDGAYFIAAAGPYVSLFKATGELVWTFEGHEASVNAVQWLDEHTFYTACFGAVRKFKINNDYAITTLRWPTSLISLKVSPNERFIACGTQESKIHFWPMPYEVDTDFEMSGYEGKVKHLDFSYDSRWMATHSSNQLILWKMEGQGPIGQEPIIYVGNEGKIQSLAFQHKSSLIASGDNHGLLAFSDPSYKRVPIGTINLGSPLTSLAWSALDEQLIVGSKQGKIWVLDSPA